jgi:acyl phosphate:glycerol-3-phosphate acyltransferase
VDLLSYSVTALSAYLLGSIPTGFLVGLVFGIDIRKEGSGNIGATNAMRILGKRAGSFVLAMDALKGYAACAWVALLVQNTMGAPSKDHTEYLLVVAGLCAVMGHNYTCWLKFKGGKGIATTAGVFGALVPSAVLLTVVVWVLVLILTRYVSLASIAAAFTLPVMVWWRSGSLLYLGTISIISVIALYKHRSNMQRLLHGTENRFTWKSAAEKDEHKA